MNNEPIKVFLVEDSPIALTILQRILQSSSEVNIVGTACNGKDALEKIPQVQPNVICTDLYMSKMDGLELTKQIMAKYPRPILVISNSVGDRESDNVFQLLQAGAIDVFPKPVSGMLSEYELVKQELIGKIKILAGVKVLTKHPSKEFLPKTQLVTSSVSPTTKVTPDNYIDSTIKIVAIGASTGGPQALQKILSQLPSHFPAPIVCIQHISVGFLQGLVNWLDSESRLKVKIAEAGELPIPGYVYFAPENYHLELNSVGKFIHASLPPIDGHCPSITATLRSTAKFYGKNAAAILLTGMGRDGASGMQDIFKEGGLTIAQDEKSCVVFGMPKEAIALGAARHILAIEDIAPFLSQKSEVRRFIGSKL
jgi:two-component system, chemotaxis family, protein-glutamate methylesterase/glutaminase